MSEQRIDIATGVGIIGLGAGCLAAVIGRMSDEELSQDASLSRHLEVVAPLVSDKTQEAREASRRTVLLLHDAFCRRPTRSSTSRSPTAIRWPGRSSLR